MTTTTLRPSGTAATQDISLVGGASAAACLNDNNDGSWVQHYVSGSTPSYDLTDLGDLGALGGGEQIIRVRARARWDTGTGGTDFYVTLENTSGQQCTPDYYTSNVGALTTFTGAWKTIAPDGGAWTLAKVNGLRLRLQDNAGGGTMPRVTEAYVDVETNYIPTTSVSAPTGTLATTTQPTITASYSDAEGDPIDAYEIKVFDAATYGAGGFSADTGTPVWTSGITATITAPTVQVSTALPNSTSYRAYVRVRQGGSVASQWSSWSYSAFAINITAPATPTIAASTDSANARNALVLQDLQNMLSPDDASFESTIGGWVVVANCVIARIAYAGASGDGSYAMDMLSAASGTMQAGSSKVACAGSTAYSAQARYYCIGAGRTVRTDIKFFDAGSSLLTSVTGTSVAISSGNNVSYCTATSPSNAAYVQIVTTVLSAASSEHWYVDVAAIVPGTSSSFAWSRGGLLSSARFEVQRSIDSGATWSAIKRLYVVGVGMGDLATLDYSDGTQAVTAYDYESQRGVAATYRVRVNAIVGTNPITSPWSATSAVTTQGAGWWLKSLTDPNSSLRPNVNADTWTVKSTERQGVFRPLGRKGAVVISDVVGGEEGTLELAFLDQASYTAFEALRARRETLLLQSAYGEHIYLHLGAERSASFPLGLSVPKRAVSVNFFEVEAP